MRAITKVGDGGYHLGASHAAPPTTSDQAKSRWSSFGHKSDVTNNLVDDQFGLCAYSEVRPDLAGFGTHIEHLEPKSQNPSRTFDYSNLVLSALSSDDLHAMARDDVFGGHAKLSEYDASLFVSCLHEDCPTYFVYLSTGKMEPSRSLTPADHGKAQYTIDLLNLNTPYLVTQRKQWIDELDALIDDHIEKGYSLEDLAFSDLIPTSNKLRQFFTATRQRYGQLAEQVLANQLPELV